MQDIKDKIQQEALARWELRGRKGLLAMGTGSGKSRVALIRAWELFLKHGENLRILLAVPTTGLRDVNWPDEVKKWNMYPLIEENLMERVCYASMPKQPKGHYHLVILDEAHRSTEYNTQLFEYVTYDELMALSATPPEDPVKAKLLEELAPTVFTYSIEDGVKDGVVADYDVVVIEVPLNAKDKTIAAGSKKKPFKTTEAKHYEYLTKQVESLGLKSRELNTRLFNLEQAIEAEQAGAKDEEVLDQLSADKLVLNKEKTVTDIRYQAAIRNRVQFIYNLESKMKVAKTLLAKILPNKRTVVFAGSIDQIEKLCSPNTYHSKRDDSALKAFKAEEIDYLGAVNALNEGQNIPNLDQGAAVQVGSKERDLVQRIGRVIRQRPGHKGKFYILVAKGTVDEKWAYSAMTGINPERVTYITPEDI